MHSGPPVVDRRGPRKRSLVFVALADRFKRISEIRDEVAGVFQSNIDSYQASRVVFSRSLQIRIHQCKACRSPQLMPILKSLRPSTKLATCSALTSSEKWMEKTLEEPVKSRFQNSWPGQEGNAGCSTVSITG